MYNLFVSGDPESWDGEHWQIELSRCVREYTDVTIVERYGSMDTDAISVLRRLPSIFAYEANHKKAPKFGILRDIIQRKGEVRIEYELHHINPFLSAEKLADLTFELDISKWELNRTHWSVKDVNLPKELYKQNIILPDWARNPNTAVDITTHIFNVGLSFPGETREYVEQVAAALEGQLGPHSYFYDNNYVAQLARPGLDMLLQDIYSNRSQLVVVFIGADYQTKEWCGVEWRAIREIIQDRKHNRIMFIRMDDGNVEGIFRSDGYVDARKFSPAEVAGFIAERVGLLVSEER